MGRCKTKNQKKEMKDYEIILSEKAEIQIEDAYFFYENIRLTLADKFLTKVNDCINSILINPFTYKIIFENYHQAIVKKFPFVIIYTQNENIILITSVYNTYRNPVNKFK
jgi:hypothetical protein